MNAQMTTARSFKSLHERPGLFAIPNPWDAGSAIHAAREVKEQGTFTYAREAIPFAEINAMFKALRAEP